MKAPDAQIAPGHDAADDVRREINALLDEYTDAQAANILNHRGLRTAAGENFDPVSVQWIRRSANLKSFEHRLLAAGWLTTNQIAARLGVNRSTVADWRSSGRLRGRICNDHGDWLYCPPPDLPEVEAPHARIAPGNDGNSPARGAV